jgi:hypothetical protein
MGELAGQPNYFIQKIWMSLKIEHKQRAYEYYWDQHVHEIEKPWDVADAVITPKLHTIRAGNRWKAGMKIHPVINNRTKNRFQFAPTMQCTFVQNIDIHWVNGIVWVYIDGNLNTDFSELTKLSTNDGFDSAEDFFAYFNTDFKGQIIHWTDLRY